MRTPPPAVHSGLAAALCLVLAACGRDGAPAVPATPAADAASASAPDGAPAPAEGRTPSLEDDLIVLTNEPFWQARTAGATLSLSGIEGQRQLDVASSTLVDGARTVVATDASGRVEIRVTAVECRDTMAGASFPFTGTLSIDGGEPIAGCARPAWMPPPGEPQ